ncbi:hypothetical protein LOTGIDRAFT_130770 [Lottia gigantea]|uniref:Galactosyltransferase N-terminal domain-containing protein n=1 Tax=Lottia gigantea TaxID=225164 RepID=V3ZRM0_LOTGI|nr:hypothetical protein LOTGIDRAFT_130770 [Lottia gigantea]ESO85200.1 hypothetical protein LOTGIDRAFT_130770 [Lottia gigantea]
MAPGGHFTPTDCKATQKLAIIIPYRDRQKHLLNFLNHFIPVLKRQKLEFTIYVIEQGDNETFNRGLLLNVGFTEALKQDSYDCFILHDVDTYLLNDKNIYRCGDKPLHLAVAVEKYGFRLPYTTYYGAITAFNRKHYEMINGFPNVYFGWGGEDDDQGIRLHTKGLNFVRRSPQIARYASAKHNRDPTNPDGKDRFGLLRSAAKRMAYDGLNSLIYNVTSIELKKLYTLITITVDRNLLEKVSIVIFVLALNQNPKH